MTLAGLYDIADRNEIPVYYFPMEDATSLSTRDAIAMDVDKLEANAQETVCLAHELGHHRMGAFYNIHSLETRSRMETRANRWAYQSLIPRAALAEVVQSGLTEIWELAEYFDVTEEFMHQAAEFYRNNP